MLAALGYAIGLRGGVELLSLRKPGQDVELTYRITQPGAR